MSQSLFFNVFPALPSTAGTNHPRIVNVATCNKNGGQNINVKLPHAVVTMLHHISTDTLVQFLDSKRPYFRLVQEWKGPNDSDKLVIAKQDNDVMVHTSHAHTSTSSQDSDSLQVGIFTEDDAKDHFAFGYLIRYAITKDGSWDMYYGSYRDYFRRNWDDVLAGNTLKKQGSPMAIWVGHDPDGDWDLLPKKLADVTMDGRAWDEKLSEWKITVH